MKLDTASFDAARAHLLGDDSDALIDHLFRLNIGQDAPGTPAVARELGWCDESGQLTETGGFVADSCREYSFWRDRDRALPFEGAGGLTRDYFAGKAVVEVGSGTGMNLMSLGHSVADLSGVEPFEIYTQLGEILRDREGLPPINVQSGSGENLPFADARFDVVLCVSAHQYMDISTALGELARVLKPGGELIIIGGTLDRYLKDAMAGFPRHLKAHVITTVNTLGYMALQRRLIAARGVGTTGRPIYPMPRSMQRWIRQAGLTPVNTLDKVGAETIFRGIRDE